MKKTTTAIVVALITVTLLVASSKPASAAWGSVTTIAGFYVWDVSAGNAHFRVANMEKPNGCSSPGYLTLDASQAHFKELYTTLMLAHTTGKTVQLSYNGCNSSGYPVINAIAVPGIW